MKSALCCSWQQLIRIVASEIAVANDLAPIGSGYCNQITFVAYSWLKTLNGCSIEPSFLKCAVAEKTKLHNVISLRATACSVLGSVSH
jgi:hypothetical protein